MKINDILNESQLNEFIPLTKQGRAIKRAEKAGAADLKASVEKLTQQFASQLGSQGKQFKSATTDDVVAFLKSKKVDTGRIDVSQPMNPKRIQTIFNELVKDKMLGKTITSKPSQEPASDPKLVKTVYSQTKAALDQLNMKEKKRLLAQLQKSIDANTKVKKTPPKPRVRPTGNPKQPFKPADT